MVRLFSGDGSGVLPSMDSGLIRHENEPMCGFKVLEETETLMIKLIRKVLLILLVLAVTAVGLVVFGRNFVARRITVHTVERMTGFQTRIGSADLQLTHSRIVMSDVVVENPKGQFQDPRCLRIARIEADVDLRSLLKKAPHFRRLVLDIPEIVAVVNASGGTNLRLLQEKGAGGAASASPEFQIDELVVSVGTGILVREDSSGNTPRTYHINVHDRVYHNVKDTAQIKAIVLDLAARALPSNLLNLSRELLEKDLKDAAGGLLERAGKSVLDLFK